MEISRQIRTNATIAYFFLGPILLLAKRNPNFAEPFVRSHAKAGSKAVLFYLAAFFAYSHYLSGYLSFPLPLVPVTADRLVSIGILALLFATLVRGASRAHAGKEAVGTFQFSFFGTFSEESGEIGHLSETDRSLVLASFVPVFGIMVASRKPSVATLLGCRAGSAFFALYAFLWISGGDAALMAASLAYAVFFVTVGASVFTAGTVPLEGFLRSIPSLGRLYVLARAVPVFVSETVSAVFGKRSELSFSATVSSIEARDRSFEKAMESFTDSSFPLPPKLVAFPVVNLLFLPRLFSASPYRYALAAGQGVALTASYVALTYFFGFSNDYQIALLPAIALLLGNVENRPFLRIPALYELYSLVGILTFGLANRARKAKEISGKQTSVSFKV